MAQIQKAMFAGGCFWGVEQTFRMLKGVKKTQVGYSGGTTKNPTYKDVCTGKTGHAEVVLIEFDPEEITYTDLVEIFWKAHDPTQLNQQGPDIGTQYRSAIFYLTEEQKKLAIASKLKKDEERNFRKPIVTEITQASKFYPAEEYHQNFVEKNPWRPCHVYIARDFLKDEYQLKPMN